MSLTRWLLGLLGDWLRCQWLLWLATGHDPAVRAWAFGELQRIAVKRAQQSVADLMANIALCERFDVDPQPFIDFWIDEKRTVVEDYLERYQ